MKAVARTDQVEEASNRSKLHSADRPMCLCRNPCIKTLTPRRDANSECEQALFLCCMGIAERDALFRSILSNHARLQPETNLLIVPMANTESGIGAFLAHSVGHDVCTVLDCDGDGVAHSDMPSCLQAEVCVCGESGRTKASASLRGRISMKLSTWRVCFGG